MSRNRATSLTGVPGLDTRRRSSAKPGGDIFIDRTKMWSNTVGKSVGLIPGRSVAGPLFLVFMSPIFVMVLHHTLVDLSGSLELFWTNARSQGIFSYVHSIWPSWRDEVTWKLIGIFMSFQLGILKFLPGEKYNGPVAPSGFIPEYRVNGFRAFLLTISLYVIGALTGLYKGGLAYDHLGNILSSMNVLGLIFCLFLYVKGRMFPSSPDHGSSGNPVFDYYWGTELYPRIFGR